MISICTLTAWVSDFWEVSFNGFNRDICSVLESDLREVSPNGFNTDICSMGE